MHRFARLLGLLALVVLIVLLALTLLGGSFKGPVKHTVVFDHPGLAAFPPVLHVDGNRLVTPSGQVMRLRGVMPVDPDDMRREGTFTRQTFAAIAAAGANVVRIPVHPASWLEDEDYLWRYLDPVTGWAGELGLYVIIDWHSIGNVQTGTAPLMPDLYAHTAARTRDFWAQTAAHFRNAPHVMFEIFNEPQGIDARTWRDSATEIAGTIRSAGARQPIIVGGLEYARDLDWVLRAPVADPDVVYAAHIYPGHSPDLWDFYFGGAAKRYPVLITEWGFMQENPSRTQPYLNGSAAAYGKALMAYLDERDIGWVACWWHDEWEPPMLREDGQGQTGFGAFVLDELAR